MVSVLTVLGEHCQLLFCLSSSATSIILSAMIFLLRKQRTRIPYSHSPSHTWIPFTVCHREGNYPLVGIQHLFVVVFLLFLFLPFFVSLCSLWDLFFCLFLFVCFFAQAAFPLSGQYTSFSFDELSILINFKRRCFLRLHIGGNYNCQANTWTRQSQVHVSITYVVLLAFYSGVTRKNQRECF